ncbi:hypothetical protein M422DRAFT_43551 [Sphaerobolus stellatus SS14]|nr:hypothetical protein M422DRAFT_43551 [Sphaerobolus stellatus SS14]
MHFYPEDTGRKVCEARQADKWLHKQKDDLLTPMVHTALQDFFIFKPTLCNDGSAVMPHRFFQKNGTLHAKIWPMEAPPGCGGWVVRQDREREIPIINLSVSWPHFVATHGSWHIPHPSNILGLRDSQNGSELDWTCTEAHDGNKWCLKSKGFPVYSVPIWLYCDDTSGNLSKKWNKHNSYLFTLARLPHQEVLKEYNVQLLSTSNLTPPLEMLEGIYSQISEGQEHGMWAWDSEQNTLILLIPWVLSFLGDNPMQNGASDTALEASIDFTPGEKKKKSKKPKKPKMVESLAEMITRVTRFMQKGVPRYAAETIINLHKIWDEGVRYGGKDSSRNLVMGFGLKDTYQLSFMEKVWDTCKPFRGKKEREAAIKTALAQYGESRVRVSTDSHKPKGLDPHSDTPVEILHVILLGFVKYFWCDAIKRVKPEQKRILAARLSSINISGLGVPPLAGNTLVAAFCLYDLVPEECYLTWLALGKLVPLVWQPDIEDIDSHLFGPASLFVTEGFESFNAVIRSFSINSNRQAPSRDIARAFARGNRIRHMLSGDSFLLKNHHPDNQDVSQSSRNPPPLQEGWRTIGSEAAYFSYTRNFIPELFGLKDDNDKGNPIKPCLRSGKIKVWHETQAALSSLNHVPLDIRSGLFKTPEKAFLEDTTPITINSFVICEIPTDIGMSTLVGEVIEFLQVIGSLSEIAGYAEYITIRPADVSKIHTDYCMCQVETSNYTYTLAFKNIVAACNVQHNCIGNKCSVLWTQPISQERKETIHKGLQVQHTNPRALILNTSQMRSAKYLQQFSPPLPPLDHEQAIYSGCTLEMALAKQRRKEEGSQGKGKAPAVQPITLLNLRNVVT